MRINPNQYYGYFDYSANIFYVVVVKPSGSKLSEWIGSRNAKLSDLLCIDDYIIAHCDFSLDWSRVHER